MALLGMELRAMDVAAPHGADQRTAVVDAGGHVVFSIANHVETVHEVETLRGLAAREQRAPAAGRDIGPADVRHLERRAFGRADAAHVGIDPSEAWLAAFLAAAGEQLH